MQESEMRFDDQRIDRFVDGEMSTTEENAFLETANQSPENWRRVALGFVESRRLGSDIGNAITSSQNAIVPAVKVARKQSEFNIKWFAATSAALLLALFAGYQFHAIQNPSMMPIVDSKDVPFDIPGKQSFQPVEKNQTEMAWVVLPDPQSDQTITVKAPIIDSDELNEEWIANAQEFGVLQNTLPETIRDSLLEAGYTIHQERVLYPIPLGNGRTAIVPIDSVEVLRGSDDLYVFQ